MSASHAGDHPPGLLEYSDAADAAGGADGVASFIPFEERGITGILMYCKHHFLQILEGREDAVMALFEKIARDGRHKEIRVLMRQQAV